MLPNVGSLIRNYKIDLELKQGAQGLVFVVEEVKTHKKYVLKSVLVEEKKKADFEMMVNTWKMLSKSKAKDFVASYYEHFYEGKNAITIMEYCSGGDLETLIQEQFAKGDRFSESDVLKVLIAMMIILEEMRLFEFIHRDIKSSNILIGADGKYKLADLNSAKNLEGKSSTTTMTGTLIFF